MASGLDFSDREITLNFLKKSILMIFGNWVGPISIEQIQGLFFLKKTFVLLLIYASLFPFLSLNLF